jgi:serine/threonine protein phosphatase PrpC
VKNRRSFPVNAITWQLCDVLLFLLQSFNSGDSVFCGVFDGHGPYGHFVAKKVRDSLPVKLLAQWKTSANGVTSPHLNGSISGSLNSEETAGAVDDEWGESVDVDGSDMLPETFLPLKHSYLKAFKSMDKELKMHPTIDCFCSGSTAVTLIKQVTDTSKHTLNFVDKLLIKLLKTGGWNIILNGG